MEIKKAEIEGLNEASSKVLISLKATCPKMMRTIKKSENRSQKCKTRQWLSPWSTSRDTESRNTTPRGVFSAGRQDSSLNFIKAWMNHSSKLPNFCDKGGFPEPTQELSNYGFSALIPVRVFLGKPTLTIPRLKIDIPHFKHTRWQKDEFFHRWMLVSNPFDPEFLPYK